MNPKLRAVLGEEPLLEPASLNQLLHFAGSSQQGVDAARSFLRAVLLDALPAIEAHDRKLAAHCSEVMADLTAGRDVVYMPFGPRTGIRIPRSGEQNTSEFRNGFRDPEDGSEKS